MVQEVADHHDAIQAQIDRVAEVTALVTSMAHEVPDQAHVQAETVIVDHDEAQALTDRARVVASMRQSTVLQAQLDQTTAKDDDSLQSEIHQVTHQRVETRVQTDTYRAQTVQVATLDQHDEAQAQLAQVREARSTRQSEAHQVNQPAKAGAKNEAEARQDQVEASKNRSVETERFFVIPIP